MLKACLVFNAVMGVGTLIACCGLLPWMEEGAGMGERRAQEPVDL